MCVTNLERSIAFYSDVFGFEVKEDHRDLKKYPWVTLGVPNAAYLILYETEKAKISRDMRIVHFGFALKQVQPIEDVLAKVLSAGIETKKDENGKPLVARYDKSSSIYLSDPDGYALDISIKFGGGIDEK